MAEENKKNNYVNYVRKPMAYWGFWSLGLTAVGIILLGAVVGLAVRYQGHVPLNVGAMAFMSLVFSICGLAYGVRALLEKEKNYILAKLSITADGVMILIWVLLLIVGLRK